MEKPVVYYRLGLYKLRVLLRPWCWLTRHRFDTSTRCEQDNYYHRICSRCWKLIGGAEHIPCSGCGLPVANPDSYPWSEVRAYCNSCSRERRPGMYR